MITVWITGAGGFIGNTLVKSARDFAPGFDIIPLTRQALDLINFRAVTERFQKDKPDVIIHCAAMSRSTDCQTNPILARRINTEATAHLAGLAKDISFIFLSTDLVFSGAKGNYVETDEPNPLSVYGETKLAAERKVLENPRHTVVRCSLVAGISPKGNHAFNEELRAAWKAGKPTKLFFDEYRTPIPAPIAARAIWKIARRNVAGLFHLAGAEKLSRVEIGKLIAARHPELAPRIEPASLREYQGPRRPTDASLNCAKLQKLLSFRLAGLNEWLKANPDADF